MANSKPVKCLVAVLAMLVLSSTSAFAKNSLTINVSTSVSLNGKQIEAGQYKVVWEEHSPGVAVSFERGRNVVATAQGKIVERDTRYPRHMLVYESSPDGSRNVTELRIGGTRQVIVFSE